MWGKTARPKPPTLDPVPEYAEIYTLKEWLVKFDYGLDDEEGFAEYGTVDGSAGSTAFCPSQFRPSIIPSWATHVIWYEANIEPDPF